MDKDFRTKLLTALGLEEGTSAGDILAATDVLEITQGDLSRDQLKAIEADPLLNVRGKK